jgi:16S rRNA C967 or C1407 C5-methylase (RsmB/RsmF family)
VAEAALRRLQTVPWDPLEGLVEAVLPSVARVLAGATAEREIDRLLRAHRELVRDGFLRTWPHLHDMDGFFAAAWRKISRWPRRSPSTIRSQA